MDKNHSLFLISGFMSLSLFVLILTSFIYMMFSSSKINIYALKKNKYISISLNTLKNNTIKKNMPYYKEKLIQTSEVDVNNLFNSIWTQDIKKQNKKIKKIDDKRFQKIQKRIKTVKINTPSSVPQTINNMNSTVVDDNNSAASTADEINEYLARIQGLVYKYFYPPQNSQGHSVKAVIELSIIGKVLDFRILDYSNNLALNEECDKIKYRLQSVVFPKNPQNKSNNYIIILTSKE